MQEIYIEYAINFVKNLLVCVYVCVCVYVHVCICIGNKAVWKYIKGSIVLFFLSGRIIGVLIFAFYILQFLQFPHEVC